MILAAGFGTRLKPLTIGPPQTYVSVLNRPLLEHTLNFLSSQGIQDIIVNVHHLPEKIIEYFGDGTDFGVRLQFSREEEILGTAGGLKKAQSFLEKETFLVLNSDVLADINFDSVLKFHKEKNSCLTLVVRQDDEPEKYRPIHLANDWANQPFCGCLHQTLLPQISNESCSPESRSWNRKYSPAYPQINSAELQRIYSRQ